MASFRRINFDGKKFELLNSVPNFQQIVDPTSISKLRIMTKVAIVKVLFDGRFYIEY